MKKEGRSLSSNPSWALSIQPPRIRNVSCWWWWWHRENNISSWPRLVAHFDIPRIPVFNPCWIPWCQPAVSRCHDRRHSSGSLFALQQIKSLETVYQVGFFWIRFKWFGLEWVWKRVRGLGYILTIIIILFFSNTLHNMELFFIKFILSIKYTPIFLLFRPKDLRFRIDNPSPLSSHPIFPKVRGRSRLFRNVASSVSHGMIKSWFV